MAELKAEEIRRFVSYLSNFLDEQELLKVEDNLSSEFGGILSENKSF